MKISEHFNLDVQQPSLDFVDVPVDTDVKVFIDPSALNSLDTPWAVRCRSLIQDYFSLVLDFIRDGKDNEAKSLLAALNEPNETHLGLSEDKPQGHGMGKDLAEKMWKSLKDSRAVSTGLIKDLEDTALMIDGVASDIISDIATNILREQLISYTQDMCKEFAIPTEEVASGPIWITEDNKWAQKLMHQPVVNETRLLLVPKGIVRRSITYDAGRYYNLYLLRKFQDEEAARGFVRLLQNGESRPLSKKSLKQKYPGIKATNRNYTPERLDVLEEFKSDASNTPKQALDHEKIAKYTHTSEPDWEVLLQNILRCQTGAQDADKYEKAIKKLFDALFYPWLMHPTTQHRIHNGRKRIDITYWNMAQDDFFYWLRENYNAPYAIIECKNYSEDPSNPELDQLSGRFSTRRGQFGILVCRKIDRKDLFETRCKDTANDGRGYIIGLDDGDLIKLVGLVKTAKRDERLSLLREKFSSLVM